MPRVSVLTPFLNAERHLDAAIASVRAQAYPDWELMLVDDGSSDSSLEIARRHAADDPGRIRVLDADPARKGAAAARNRGLEDSGGALIACLDADDLYGPQKLKRDVQALDAAPDALWVYSASRWFFEARDGRDWTEQPGVARDRTHPGTRLLQRVLLRERGDVPCPCAVMIRREAMLAAGGFEERFTLYEDQALWAKLLLAGPVHVRSGCDAAYRQHAASTSTAAAERGDYHAERPHPARRIFLEWLERYAATAGADAGVRKALEAALGECDRSAASLGRRLRRLSRYLPALP